MGIGKTNTVFESTEYLEKECRFSHRPEEAEQTFCVVRNMMENLVVTFV